MIHTLRLVECASGAIFIGTFAVQSEQTTIATVIDKSNAFENWLAHQILALHGIDLGELTQATLQLSGGKEMK